MVLNNTEREMVADHEPATPSSTCRRLLAPLYRVSIVPRGQALGVTTLLPTEDQNLQSKNYLLEQLAGPYGRARREKVFYGVTTNGAAGDLTPPGKSRGK